MFLGHSWPITNCYSVRCAWKCYLYFADMKEICSIFLAEELGVSKGISEHFRQILPFEFNRGAKAAGDAKTLVHIRGECHWRKDSKKIVSSLSKRLTWVIHRVLEGHRAFEDDILSSLILDDPRQSTRWITISQPSSDICFLFMIVTNSVSP